MNVCVPYNDWTVADASYAVKFMNENGTISNITDKISKMNFDDYMRPFEDRKKQ